MLSIRDTYIIYEGFLLLCFLARVWICFRPSLTLSTNSPDGLKLYPTLVIRGTGLYELWKTKQYQNYSPIELVDIIAELLALIPPWVRYVVLCVCV